MDKICILWCLLVMLSYCLGYQKIQITMPNVQPKKKESYLCTYKHLPKDTTYAYKFIPLADETTAHHMLVFACEKPKHYKTFWDCTNDTPCRGEEQIIYAWAKNAMQLQLPKKVGFQVGADNMAGYIVTQIHYARPLKDSEWDNSGVVIHLTYNIPKYFASIFLFSASLFSIPPNVKGHHVDIACRYRGQTIKPFAFRTHTHRHGRSISAYRIRREDWNLIGIGDPQKPQAFYNIKTEERMLLKDGDVLAARCTFDSLHDNKTIHAGSFSSDEMCNFYMMYYGLNTDEDVELQYGCDRVTHKLDFPSDSELPFKDHPKVVTAMPPTNTQETIEPTKTTEIATKASKKANTHTHKPKTDPSPTTLHSLPTTKTHKASVRPNKKVLPYTPVLESQWGVRRDIEKRLREIVRINVDKDDSLIVLHSGNRKLSFDSFDDENYFVEHNKPISKPTIFKINSTDGTMMKAYGQNMLFLPSAMAIDGEGNYWITDLGYHQLLKLSPHNLSDPLLVLGVRGIPGSDLQHLCGPYDVIFDKENNVYVADGYCNRRIVKLNSNGKPVKQFGHQGILRRPHSLAIDSVNNRLFVADQGTGSIHVFSTSGHHVEEFKSDEYKGHRLKALVFSHINDGLLFTMTDRNQGYTLNAKTGRVLNKWDPVKKDSSGIGKSIALSNNHKSLYAALQHPSRLLKFNIYQSKGNRAGPTFPWSEVTTPTTTTTNSSQNNNLELINERLSTKDDVTIVPALVVVGVLATPIILVLVALIVQNLRVKNKARKLASERKLPSKRSRNATCCGCCVPSRYYYDGNRDFDKLVLGSSDDETEEEEDLFTRKA